MTETAVRISLDARLLGVKEGDTLLLHSSLKSLGGGVTPRDVIEGLLDAVGESGTLVLPALSYLTCNKSNPHFDYYKTKSNVGAIPEYFRTEFEGVKRSISPTHSCCACGRNADFVTEGHILDHTPCGKNSPFRRVYELGGKLLFIGCGLGPNTSMHGVEELSEPPYLFGEDVEYTLTDAQGVSVKSVCRSHGFKGVYQRYDRIYTHLSEDELHFGKILSADCYLLDAVATWQKAHELYRQDSLYFIDKAD